jgi:23S rRNA pseudouridine1911/1915/1917 synthase
MNGFVIEQSWPRERLDAFLRERFPNMSRSTWQRLIAQGAVKINGQQVKVTHHPMAGERVDITWPKPESPVTPPEAIALKVLYEDEDLLVIDKPAGLVVHPAAGHPEHTLVNALLHHCAGQLSGIGGVARPGIVHRLDKDTSGCLVVAKNDFTHLGLARLFASRKVSKTYLAIVCGRMAQGSGDIRAAVARHPTHRKRMAVMGGQGRDAWTSYRVLELLEGATLVEAQLHTGRTHQVRVHFQHLGHPLVGDQTYGKRPNQRLREETGCQANRQMLHAWKLALVHPRQERLLSFEAPWPEDFTSILQALRRP